MLPVCTPVLEHDLDDRSSGNEQRLRLLTDSTPSKLLRVDHLIPSITYSKERTYMRIAVACMLIMLAAILALQVLQLSRTSSAPIAASLTTPSSGSAELKIAGQESLNGPLDSEATTTTAPFTATQLPLTPTSPTTLTSVVAPVPRAPHVLIVWQGFGGKDANQTAFKEKWMVENHRRIESTKENYQVDYRVYCFLDYNITVPDGVELIYEKGIVWQYTWRHLQPDQLSEKYDYIMFIMDDIILAEDYSLQEAIDIYERNQLDLECLSLDPSERHDSWAYMKADRGYKVGRRMRICEFYVYLFKMSSYTHFFHRLLSVDSTWGWGVDLSLWSEAGLFVGLVDKWPLSHKIHHEMYSDKLANPNDELQKHSGRAADAQVYGELK